MLAIELRGVRGKRQEAVTTLTSFLLQSPIHGHVEELFHVGVEEPISFAGVDAQGSGVDSLHRG